VKEQELSACRNVMHQDVRFWTQLHTFDKFTMINFVSFCFAQIVTKCASCCGFIPFVAALLSCTLLLTSFSSEEANTLMPCHPNSMHISNGMQQADKSNSTNHN